LTGASAGQRLAMPVFAVYRLRGSRSLLRQDRVQVRDNPASTTVSGTGRKNTLNDLNCRSVDQESS